VRELDIALFGCGGQLGSAICRLAEEREIALSAFSRSDCDVTDEAAVRNAVDSVRPTVIVNAAAYTSVDRAEKDLDAAFAVNRDGVANIARAARVGGAGLIHVSTDYVFDGRKPAPYLESDPVAPVGVYGMSKAEGEKALQAAMPENAVILRTAWVYGLEGGNFVKTMLRLGAERDVVRVVDDQRGSPTFADDLASAIIELAGKLAPGPSTIYHTAGRGTATWHEVAREIFAASAKRGLAAPRLEAITTAQYPTPAKRPANSVLDCSRLARDFAIELPDWRDGLHRMLNAHFEAAR
jgi:dTDP-4-dehydrorhamnose reductase